MANTKKRKKGNSKTRFLYLIPVVIWMIFIFYMSSKDGQGSSALSGEITEKLGNLIEKLRNDTPEARQCFMEGLETIIRKAAHMAEYAILFGLVLLAVKKINLKSEKIYNVLLAIAVCFLYACTDEVHQLFVDGRCGSMRDVLIDMVGVLICLPAGLAVKDKKWRIIVVFTAAILLVGLFVFLLFFDFTWR